MKQRIKILDFLRGIAIFLVMLRHVYLTPVTTHIGWIGVDLFFVLSGFLVSGILFSEYKKTGKVNAGRFLIRRGFKIYPLFYCVLFLHIAYNYLKQIPTSSQEIFAEVFFYQNYVRGVLGISWSLAVEEHFYLILSIGLLILYKQRRKVQSKYYIPLCVLILAVSCLLLRFYTWNIYNPSVDYRKAFATHLRIDSLAFGVLIAWLYHFENDKLIKVVKRVRFIIIVVIPFLLLPAFIYDANTKIMVTTGFTYLYIAFGLLLILLLVYSNEVAKFLSQLYLLPIFNFIAWVGLYSYPIYLINLEVGPLLSNYIVINYISLPLKIVILLNFAFNILCGYILSLVIERPFLQLREKYYPAAQ